MPFTVLVHQLVAENGSVIVPPYNETNCTDGVAPWLFTLLHQCALDKQRYASLILGLISLVAWVVAAFPQLYENCRQGIPDVALSPFMLINWMLGDGCNLVGALLSKQLPFQIYVATFYVCSDVINLSQFGYFKVKAYYKRKRDGEVLKSYPPNNGYKREVIVSAVLLFFGFTYFSFPEDRLLASQSMEVIKRPGSRTLLVSPANFIFPNMITDVGFALGTISAIFYFASRIPQIIKNFKRKCTEGLSLALFIMALIGNGTYGLSVLLQSVDGIFVIQHMPWLVGSLGVMALDFTIALQFFMYRNKPETERKRTLSVQERTPLLSDERYP